jgi:hypothetical protein
VTKHILIACVCSTSSASAVSLEVAQICEPNAWYRDVGLSFCSVHNPFVQAAEDQKITRTIHTNFYFEVLLLHQSQHFTDRCFLQALVFSKCKDAGCGSVMEAPSLGCVDCAHAMGNNGDRKYRRYTSKQSGILLLSAMGGQTA